MRFPTRNSPSLRSSVSPQSFATPTAWREKVKPQNKLVEQMGGLPMNELSGSFNQDSMDSDSFGSSQFDLHASIEFEIAPSNQDADPSPMQNFSARPKKKNNRVSMMTGAFESAPAPSRGLVAPKTTGWVEKQKVGNNLVKQMGFDTLNLEDDDVDEEKLDSLIGKATAAFGTKGEGTASSGSKDSGPSALPSFGAKPKKKNNRVSMMAGALESTPASPGRFVSRGLNAPKTTGWVEKKKVGNSLVNQMGLGKLNLDDDDEGDEEKSDSLIGKASNAFGTKGDAVATSVSKVNDDSGPSALPSFGARPKKKINRVSMMAGAFESAPAPSRGLVAPKTTGWVEKQKVGNGLVNQMGLGPLKLDDDDDVDEEKLDSLIGKATAAFGTKGDDVPSSGSKANEDSGPSAMPSFGARPKKKNNRISMMAGVFESTPASPRRFVSRGLNAPKTTGWVEKKKVGNSLVNQMGLGPLNLDEEDEKSESLSRASTEFTSKGGEVGPSASKANNDFGPSALPSFGARPKKKNNRVSMMAGAFESSPAPSRGLVAPKTTGWVEKQKVGNNLMKQMGLHNLNLDDDDDVDEEKLDSLIGKAAAAFGTKRNGVASSESKVDADAGPSALPSFGAKPKKKNNRVSMMAGAFESTPASPGRFVSRGLNAPKTTGWVEKKKVGNSLVNQMGLGKLNLDDDAKDDEKSNTKSTSQRVGGPKSASLADDSQQAPTTPKSLDVPTAASKSTGWREKLKLRNNLVRNMVAQQRLLPMEDMAGGGYDVSWGKRGSIEFTGDDDIARAAFMSRSSSVFADEDDAPVGDLKRGSISKRSSGCNYRASIADDDGPVRSWFWGKRTSINYIDDDEDDIARAAYHSRSSFVFDDDDDDDPRVSQMRKSLSKRMSGLKRASFSGGSKQAPAEPKELEVPTASSKSAGWREKLKLKNDMLRNMVTQQRLLPMEDLRNGGYDAAWGQRASIEFTGDDEIARAAFMSRSSFVFDNDNDGPIGDLKRGSISKRSSGYNYCASFAAAPATPSSNAGPQGNASKSTGYVEKLKLRNNLLRQMGQHSLPLGDDDENLSSSFWGKRTSINYIDDDDDDIARSAYHSRSSFVFDDNDDPRVSRMRKSMSQRKSAINHRQSLAGVAEDAPSTPKELEVPTARCKSTGWREKLKLKNELVRQMVAQQGLLPMEDMEGDGYDASWGKRASINFLDDDDAARAAYQSRSSFVFDG